MSSSSTPAPSIDIESPVFAMRFANLLRATRLDRGTSYRALVRATGGTWTKDRLKQVEDGLLTLDESMVESISMAYGADLGSILPSRLPVAIDDGVISAGGVKAVFVPRNETSLLTAYLRLIRSMRRQRKAPMIALRREDIEVLSAHLDLPGEAVVDRLTSLMGATLPQRTAIAAMFATGAVVIGLAGATVAGGPDRTPNDVSDQQTVAVVAEATSTSASAARSDSTIAIATIGRSTIESSTIDSSTIEITDDAGTPDAVTVVTAVSAPPTPSTGSAVVVRSAPAIGSAPSGVSEPAPAPVTPAIPPGSAEPPLVPEGTVPAPASDPTEIVATDDPPVPPVVATDDPVVPGSAEPPLVPPETAPAPVEVGTPPVPG